MACTKSIQVQLRAILNVTIFSKQTNKTKQKTKNYNTNTQTYTHILFKHDGITLLNNDNGGKASIKRIQ